MSIDIIDYDDSGESHGALIKCIAQAKAHLFMLCKAGRSHSELNFHGRAWETFRNPAGDLLVGCWTNLVGPKLRQLAGSTLVGVVYHHRPLTYMMIVEITFGVNCSHRWTRQARILS